MNKTVKILAIASFFVILLVGCSKKSTKANNNNDSAVQKLETKKDSSAEKKNAQNKLFDIPESPASDFSYELSDDNSGVKITAYKGGANCRIPSEIEGMPVTEIASNTFFNTKFGKSLVVLVMPDTIKKVGKNCFGFCSSLSAVKLSSSLSVIEEEMFQDCDSLEEIVIPASVTTIKEKAFSSSGLKSIYIPDTVIEIEGGPGGAFSDCKNLSKVRLPSTLKILPEGTFGSCHSLESIELPNGITEIGGNAFAGCRSLSSIILPESITKIRYGAFQNCESLT